MSMQHLVPTFKQLKVKTSEPQRLSNISASALPQPCHSSAFPRQFHTSVTFSGDIWNIKSWARDEWGNALCAAPAEAPRADKYEWTQIHLVLGSVRMLSRLFILLRSFLRSVRSRYDRLTMKFWHQFSLYIKKEGTLEPYLHFCLFC